MLSPHRIWGTTEAAPAALEMNVSAWTYQQSHYKSVEKHYSDAAYIHDEACINSIHVPHIAALCCVIVHCNLKSKEDAFVSN